MKFEHVLRIYWLNYFLFNGRHLPLNISLTQFLNFFFGLGVRFKKFLILRFELFKFYYNSRIFFSDYDSSLSYAINMLVSKMSSINNSILEMDVLHIVRLYLLKTMKGRSHMLGKPVRGQRTWSNAWTAYNSNRLLRSFVTQAYLILNKDIKVEKIDYKRLKKKQKKKSSSPSAKKLKKSNLAIWF